MRKLYCFMWIAALGAASTLLLAGCDDNETPPPGPSPKVTLSDASATLNSLTFTILPSDATECAYLCLKKAETAPTASEILAKGVFTESVDKASVITIPKLEALTEYVIYASAANGKILSEVATLAITTLEAPAPTEVIQFKSATKTSISYSIALEGDFGFFHLAMPKALWNELLYGELGMLIDPNDEEAVLEGKIITITAFGRLAEQSGDFDLVLGETFIDSFGDEMPVEVVAGVEYLLIVAASDENGFPVAPFYDHTFRTPDPDPSAATVDLTVLENELYPDAIGVRMVPSADTHCFYVAAVATAELEAAVAERGEEAERDFAVALGFRFVAEDEGLLDMLEPDTDYTVLALVIDIDGNQAIIRKEAHTPAESAPAAVKTSVLKRLSAAARSAAGAE